MDSGALCLLLFLILADRVKLLCHFWRVYFLLIRIYFSYGYGIEFVFGWDLGA